MSTVQTNRIQHSTGTGNNIVLSAEGDTQINSLNGSFLGGHNQIINGSMQIAQRGTGNNSAAVDDFTVDRWRAWVSGGTTNAFGWGRAVCTINAATALGFFYALEIRNPISPEWNIKQGIELHEFSQFPFTQGSTWTFSCYASAEVSAFLAKASGTGVGSNANGCTRTSSNYDSITGKYVATFTIDAANPDDFNCMSIAISNATGTINAATQIVACQLEPGSVPTPFEHRPYAIELALCQRYYQQHVSATDGLSYGFGGVGGTANTDLYCPIQLPTTMRAVPTVTSTAPVSAGCNVWALAGAASVRGFTYYTRNTGTGAWNLYADYTADAEL